MAAMFVVEAAILCTRRTPSLALQAAMLTACARRRRQFP